MAIPRESLLLEKYASPVGGLRIGTVGQSVCIVSFGSYSSVDRYIAKYFADVTWGQCPGHIHSALDRYFDGELKAFDELDVELKGTSFQKKVWEALLTVPAGMTCSYRDIAEKIGNPAAVRAVGLANGQNPIAIIVPCHRIIGSNGALTGYGGGLDKKRWLLEHEGALPQTDLF